MSHGVNFAVLPALADAFKSPVAGTFALKVKIENEAFTLASTLAGSDAGADADFGRMKDSFLSESEACYCLHKGAGDGAWSLLAFVPEGAPVRDKMTYSSGRAVLVKALGGAESIPVEKHCDSLDEVLPPSAAQSETARIAEQRTLMTDVEKLKIDGDLAMAAEAAAGKIGSVVGLTFPMVAEAEAGLAAFRAGSLGALVLAIEGETMVKKGEAPPSASVATLKAAIPAEPCYCLYKWAHEKGGVAATSSLFLYICPESAPVRGKMLHASTEGPFISGLQASGLTFDKSVEGVEAAELTDSELLGQVYTEDVGDAGPKTVTKAAPKGGRRLVKKRADPVEAS